MVIIGLKLRAHHVTEPGQMPPTVNAELALLQVQRFEQVWEQAWEQAWEAWEHNTVVGQRAHHGSEDSWNYGCPAVSLDPSSRKRSTYTTLLLRKVEDKCQGTYQVRAAA